MPRKQHHVINNATLHGLKKYSKSATYTVDPVYIHLFKFNNENNTRTIMDVIILSSLVALNIRFPLGLQFLQLAKKTISKKQKFSKHKKNTALTSF